ncbi:hypothetical protein BLNAU_21277 [Blattamonas nauphoetae]|uniref:Uncharacterized protein n=1 Tax=Blattamonas nauphoetae TaxID=2049346 RepID=A0ABQ9WWD3_9EUKA|nr:hypothetical protein BLNAU_21277 [Blattamonas nauphoetae]
MIISSPACSPFVITCSEVNDRDRQSNTPSADCLFLNPPIHLRPTDVTLSTEQNQVGPTQLTVDSPLPFPG